MFVYRKETIQLIENSMVNLKKNVRNVVTFPYFRKKKELFNIYGLDQRRLKLCELIRNPLIRHSR